jgi:hypothetical protein
VSNVTFQEYSGLIFLTIDEIFFKTSSGMSILSLNVVLFKSAIDHMILSGSLWFLVVLYQHNHVK